MIKRLFRKEEFLRCYFLCMNKDASISEKLWPFIFALFVLMLISLSEAGNVFKENVL